MQDLWQAVYLAEEMGAGLGAGSLLFTALPKKQRSLSGAYTLKTTYLSASQAIPDNLYL